MDELKNNNDLVINNLTVTLVNSMVQKINDELHLEFECDEKLSKIYDALDGNKADIVYGNVTYSGYKNITEFGYKYTNDGQEIYHVALKQDEPQEVTDDMEFALQIARDTMTDQQALLCMSIFDAWESYIGWPLKQGTRFIYKEELWKARMDIGTVLENQAPSTDTASLYERIDEDHKGTKEDPIPYATTMAVFKDKYYIEDGIVYLCTRDSGQPLYAKCVDLIGHYFQKIEK